MVPTGQPEVDVCPAFGMALWAGLQKKKKKVGLVLVAGQCLCM